jgi:iron complex transport system ATP-binding protein
VGYFTKQKNPVIMSMEKIVTIASLAIGYNTSAKEKKVVASNINLSLLKGELVCLLGPNGAGKSTLMRTLSGMQAPLAGKVFLEGENLHQLPSRTLAKNISVVLTEKVEGGLLTAYEVVSLGRYPYTNWSGTLTHKDHEIISWAISMVGADELASRTLSELSDGERQKIMMARALAQEPKVMILDEVTAFLDLPRRVEFMRLLRKMAHETNRAVLLSTHDLDLALRGSDKIWLLPKGGNLTEGAPEDLVLNGDFERAFASEGVQFDKQKGAFHIHAKLRPEVYLSGPPELVSWTQRSMERIGLCAVEEYSSSLTHIEITTESHSPVWTVTRNKNVQTYLTVYDLVNGLRV